MSSNQPPKETKKTTKNTTTKLLVRSTPTQNKEAISNQGNAPKLNSSNNNGAANILASRKQQVSSAANGIFKNIIQKINVKPQTEFTKSNGNLQLSSLVVSNSNKKINSVSSNKNSLKESTKLNNAACTSEKVASLKSDNLKPPVLANDLSNSKLIDVLKRSGCNSFLESPSKQNKSLSYVTIAGSDKKANARHKTLLNLFSDENGKKGIQPSGIIKKQASEKSIKKKAFHNPPQTNTAILNSNGVNKESFTTTNSIIDDISVNTKSKRYSSSFAEICGTYRPMTQDDKAKFIEEMAKETQTRLNVYGNIFINIQKEIQNLEKTGFSPKNMSPDTKNRNESKPNCERNSIQPKRNKANKKSLDEIIETKEVEENETVNPLNISKKSSNLDTLKKKKSGVKTSADFNQIKKSKDKQSKTNLQPIISPLATESINYVQIELVSTPKQHHTDAQNEKEKRNLFKIQYEQIVVERAKRLVDELKPYNGFTSPFENYAGYKINDIDDESNMKDEEGTSKNNIPISSLYRSNKLEEIDYKSNRRLYSLSMANNIKLNSFNFDVKIPNPKLETDNDTPLVCKLLKPELSNFKRKPIKDVPLKRESSGAKENLQSHFLMAKEEFKKNKLTVTL